VRARKFEPVVLLKGYAMEPILPLFVTE
jgi:hypothetical protein